MKVTVNRWGNSLAIRIPNEAVKYLDLSAGSELYLDLEDQKEIKLRLNPHAKLESDLKKLGVENEWAHFIAGQQQSKVGIYVISSHQPDIMYSFTRTLTQNQTSNRLSLLLKAAEDRMIDSALLWPTHIEVANSDEELIRMSQQLMRKSPDTLVLNTIDSIAVPEIVDLAHEQGVKVFILDCGDIPQNSLIELSERCDLSGKEVYEIWLEDTADKIQVELSTVSNGEIESILTPERENYLDMHETFYRLTRTHIEGELVSQLSDAQFNFGYKLIQSVIYALLDRGHIASDITAESVCEYLEIESLRELLDSKPSNRTSRELRDLLLGIPSFEAKILERGATLTDMALYQFMSYRKAANLMLNTNIPYHLG